MGITKAVFTSKGRERCFWGNIQP